MDTKRAAFLSLFYILISTTSSFAAMKKELVYIVFNDDTTVEGRYQRENRDKYTIKVGYKTKVYKKSEIKKIYHLQGSTLDRFRIKRKANDLMLLHARHAWTRSLDACQEIVDKINASDDPLKAANDYIDKHKLLPEYLDKKVEANRQKFLEKHKGRAHEIVTSNYYILSTADKKLTKKLANQMTAIFKEYQKQLVFPERIKTRFIVQLLADKQEYIQEGGSPSSAAHYSTHKMALVGYPQYSEESTFRTFYHEGMHQFLHFYVPKPPRWFDEGLAEFFEVSMPTRRGFNVGGGHPSAGKTVTRAINSGKKVSVEELIGLNWTDFYSKDLNQKSLNYASAWVLTHLMIKGKSAAVRRLWAEYFFLLRDGVYYTEANKKIFGKFNMKALQKAFEKHAKAN